MYVLYIPSLARLIRLVSWMLQKGSSLMSIIYTIIIFCVIIFVHELGHFLTAKLCGVKVIEFALGMGPKILKYQGKETLYTLRLFPIGGFAAMEGEDSESESERSFSRQNVPKRLLICVAGATMNLVLGFAIIGFSLIGVKTFATTTVHSFKEGAVSSQSGLSIGDKIVKVDNLSVFTDRDIVYALLRDGDGETDFVVKRGNERVSLPGVKFATTEEEEGKKVLTFDFIVNSEQADVFSGFSRAFRETVSLARNSWMSVGDLLTGKVSFTELSGPIGVGQVVAQAVKIGFTSVLSLAAFISISIGMFNLLPFPALDGGRMVIYVIEAIRRKPINPKVEGYINGAGLLLLFGLMIVITAKDIFNLF